MQKEEEKPTKEKPVITEEQKDTVKSETGTKGHKFRNLEDKTTVPFGVRYSYAEESGEVIEQYYPITQAGELVGYKVREVPKDFRSIGRTGATTECFMQFKFTRGGKYVVLTEGEIDALSAYQMFKAYNDSRGADYEIAVVSATTGAKSEKQVANNYKFFDSFENIIIAYDNDTAGQKAIESIVKVLPKGKVKIMQMKHKDANEYLEKGDQKAFISDFYNAKTYVPTGVVGSNQISDQMRSEIKTPRIPLPPFMRKAQDMMAGGIPLGRIVNLVSASGTGKSTITDEFVYYGNFNFPYKTGIVTLESTTGQYGIKLLSRHIGKKIELMHPDDAQKFLEEDWVKKKEHELFNDEEGNPRFYLVDDRDGEVEDIQDAVENLIIGCGCKIVILDPVHDVIATLPLEEQETFMAWQKGMVKSHGCTFINVCHTRKTGNGREAGSAGGSLNEEDIHGSGAIYKSAACNLVFTRNKEAEDDVERNTTYMKMTKCRWTGKTGSAGEFIYDNETHTLHDKEKWMQENGVEF